MNYFSLKQIKKISNDSGYLLLVVIIVLVVAGLAVSSALLATHRIEEERKELSTYRKIQITGEELVGSGHATYGENGSPLFYVSEYGGFPANASTFVTNGYLKYYGLNDASYTGEVDAYGNSLTMSSGGGTYTIDSASGDY